MLHKIKQFFCNHKWLTLPLSNVFAIGMGIAGKEWRVCLKCKKLKVFDKDA